MSWRLLDPGGGVAGCLAVLPGIGDGIYFAPYPLEICHWQWFRS